MNSLIAEKRAQRLAAHYDPENLSKMAMGSFTAITEEHIQSLVKIVGDASRISVDRAVLSAFNSKSSISGENLVNKRQSSGKSKVIQ